MIKMITSLGFLILCAGISHASNNLQDLSGEVIHGQQEARTLGYPTANIILPKDVKPKAGVYACFVTYDDKDYTGMGYTDQRRPDTFEVHLFGFEGDLYGRVIAIKSLVFLREPEAFTTIDRLKQLFKQDADHCLRARPLQANATADAIQHSE